MSDPTNPFQNRNELKDHFEIKRLRAELAAEREHKVEAMAAVIRAVDLKIEAEAERDELQLQIKNEQWKVLSLQRMIGAMVQERHKITAERDALRAALERIADADPDDGTGYVHAVANAALKGDK